MNTYHIAFTRVVGKEPMQMKLSANTIADVVTMVEETMPLDDQNNLRGEIFYVVKVNV